MKNILFKFKLYFFSFFSFSAKILLQIYTKLQIEHTILFYLYTLFKYRLIINLYYNSNIKSLNDR